MIFENFRNFLVNKPPAVVFLICLFCFIVILSSFIDYVQKYEIINPDEFYSDRLRTKISELDFCIKHPFEKISTSNNEIDLKKEKTDS